MTFANTNNQTDNRKQDSTNKWREGVKIPAGLFAYVVKPKALPPKVLKCTDNNTKGPAVVARVTIWYETQQRERVRKSTGMNLRML